MSNILIIKLGSLGDVVQISGALRDIREHHKNEKITILTTSKYLNLFKNCPYVDNCLEDERLPRYNIFYLLRLRKIINSLNFNKVYDLQNSNRTNFYRKFLFNVKNWSSSRDIPENKYNNSVLQRFDEQLRKSNIKTLYTLKPDFSWAAEKANNYNLNTDKKYILFFPFCSRDLIHKRWPYFSELINLIKQNHPEYSLVVAPGPGEIEEAKSLHIKIALNNKEAERFEEINKYKTNLTFQSPLYEKELFAKDTTDLKEKRERWHESLSQDVYVEEALNVLKDLKTSYNIKKVATVKN